MTAKPTTEELATYITTLANSVIRRETKAREELTEAVASGRKLDSYTLKPAMTAQAEALPWRHVLQRTNEERTIVEALATVREELIRNLLERGEGQSTCALSNELERMDREAARRFLDNTRGLA